MTPSTSIVLEQVASHNHLEALVERHMSTASSALDRLDSLTDIIEHAEVLRAQEVRTARSNGDSWTKIGRQLGMTKQAAHQKYGTKAQPKPDPAQLTLDAG